MIFEIVRREAVCHVQRKIADAPRVREKIKVVVVADEITVGVAGANLLENPFIARLEDARRGDKNTGRGWRIENGRWSRAAARGVKKRDGFAVFLRIFKLAIHRRCTRSEEHTSELQSRQYLVCRLLLEKII